MKTNSPAHNDTFQHIIQQLTATGYCICASALPADITQGLYQHVCTINNNAFSPAGIGRHGDLHQNESYRKDNIHWLDTTHHAEASYLDWMEQLRVNVNRQLFMGLFTYEAHFAHYPPGAFYKRHLDTFKNHRFKNQDKRVLTTVFYLNPEWHKNDGGELLIYESENSSTPYKTVSPIMGTLVIFLSEQFPHEVIEAHRDRYSIAGWFKVNN